MWKVTIKGLLAHKGRMVLTAVAVLLGVAFMSGVQVLGDTLNQTFNSLFADINKGTDGYVRREATVEVFGQKVRGRVDESLLPIVRQVDGVAEAQGNVQGYASVIGSNGKPINDGQGSPNMGMAWDPSPTLSPWRLTEGRAPAQAGEIVIDKRSADVGKLTLGTKATVLTKDAPGQFTIVGIARFGTADSPAGASVAIFTLPEAQRLVAQPGQLDGIAVVAGPGVSQEQVTANIAKALPAGTEALTGKALTKENQSDIQKSLAFFNTFLLVFAAIALFVGSFIIYNTFSIIVAQRGKEMALLRAIGASRGQVLRSILLEAAVVGLIAGAVGLVTGIALSIGLKSALSAFGIDLPSGSIVVTSGTVITSFVVGVGITLASAFFPARKASRVPPVAAMRDVAVDSSGTSRVRLVIGVVVAVLGAAALVGGLSRGEISYVGLGVLLTFVGLAVLGPLIARPLSKLIGRPVARLRGVTGQLARNNAARNPKRTASTASALMIGLGLVAFIVIFGASAKASVGQIVDENFKGDFVVRASSGGGPPGQGGVSPKLTAQLNQTPEVEVATGIRFNFMKVDGGATQVLGVDPVTVTPLFDIGIVGGKVSDLDTEQIAVSKQRMEDKGWKLGDTVPVEFADTGAKTFTIAAVYTADQLAGPYVIGHAAYDANFADVYDFQVYVARKAGGSDADAKAAITKVVSAYPGAQVEDRAEFKQAQADQINQFLGLITVMLAFAVIISFFGIWNTLALSIIERKRELGVLRAVGMTRAQVRASIRWESVIIALQGTALGLVVGVFFSWAVVRALKSQGFTVYSLPLVQLLFIAVFAALAAVAMSVFPARRAARQDVLLAIATE